jgi:nitrogen fixation/metabolism regulation signal transduction histidine kinase
MAIYLTESRDERQRTGMQNRREQGGTGMGLAIVKAIMTSHGGAIRLLPGDDGAAFELAFPAA